MIRLNDNEGRFYIKAHHIVIDAWSINLLVNQIMQYYSLIKNNPTLSKDKYPSYIDYILSEEEYKYSEKLKKNKEFWNNKFSTVPECISIKQHSTGYTNIKAERKTFIVPHELSLKIKKYCKQYTNLCLHCFWQLCTPIFIE